MAESLRYLWVERSVGSTSRWVISGPFAAAEAERAATAVLGTPTCLGAQICTLSELVAMGKSGVIRFDQGGVVRHYLAGLRSAVLVDYPEAAAMPKEVLGEYLGGEGRRSGHTVPVSVVRPSLIVLSHLLGYWLGLCVLG